MRTRDATGWVQDFELEAGRRRIESEPAWEQSARLDDAVVHSVQRFQVGEDGGGAYLIDKAGASGDAKYLQAVHFVVAEERNHARLLARLLAAAGAHTIETHWMSRMLVRVQRASSLSPGLMVLMIAEVISLRYYRALRDGTDDPLTTDVAGRIFADEQRHVRFHSHQLRESFAMLSRFRRAVVAAGWKALMAAVVVGVAFDHGRALHSLGMTRRGFVADVLRQFKTVVADVSGTHRIAPDAPESHIGGSGYITGQSAS